MSITTNPLLYMCLDNTRQVFSNLSPIDLAKSSTVSKSWQLFAADDAFWNSIPSIPSCIKKDYKKYIDNVAVVSYGAIAEKFEKFASEVSLDGAFYCVFPFSSECSIFADLGCGNIDLWDKKPEKKSAWIFMKALPDEENEKFSLYDGSGFQQGAQPFFTINNVRNYYHDRQFTLNTAEPGYQALADRIQQASLRRIDELNNQSVRREKVWKYGLGFICIAAISYGLFLVYSNFFGR